MEQKPSNHDFFQYYLKQKINNGEKQKDIADSNPELLNTSYVSKIYTSKIKTIPINKQRAIADYFDITLDELIEEGKKFYYNQHNRRSGNTLLRSSNEKTDQNNTDELINLLNRVAGGIKKNRLELEEAEKQIETNQVLIEETEILKAILSQLDAGVTFFDRDKRFVYSNYKSGFLSNSYSNVGDTIDGILLSKSHDIDNFQEIVNSIQDYYNSKLKKLEFTVLFKDKRTITSKMIPIFDQNKDYLGTLIVSTPQSDTQPTNLDT